MKNNIITLESVKGVGIETALSISIMPGDQIGLITSHESEGESLIRIILGFLKPLEGKVQVFGQKPFEVNESDLIKLRRKIGVVYSEGGLLSNLPVWENIMLPLSYHSSCPETENESACFEALELVGYKEKPSDLPGSLSILNRRLAAIARSILLKPELMIYHSTFDSLSRQERADLSFIIKSLSRSTLGAASLFITSNPQSIEGLTSENIYLTTEVQE